MTKNGLILLVVAALVVGGVVLVYSNKYSPSSSPSPSAMPTVPVNDHQDLINVFSPVAQELIESPVTITGQARGTWYFEASFPVKIYDGYGRLLGSAPAQAQGEWMTENFVPFKATLTFVAPSTDFGKLVLEKDNPSGLAENDDQIEIPIRFDVRTFPQRTVSVYYYNAANDKDASGNVLCSRQGLVPVQRQIASTTTPIQDTIRLLLQGNLTAAEKGRGITTEYPLSGFEFEGASVKNGVMTLAFKDPSGASVGGSCRVGILWAQIEATARQFPGVSSVKFMPEELFQP